MPPDGGDARKGVAVSGHATARNPYRGKQEIFAELDPKTVTLGNARHLVLRPLARDDLDRLCAGL